MAQQKNTTAWQSLLEMLQGAWAVLTGSCCAICGKSLIDNGLCPQCWFSLSYTRLKGRKGNMLERVFWAEPNVERVSSFLWYKPEYAVAQAVHAFKYHGRTALARSFGRAMATELRDTDFFAGVDGLIPVPLSRQRHTKRGYNQSEWLAKGVADVTGLPLFTDLLARCVDNPSQTTLAPSERKANVAGIFTMKHPERWQGKCFVLIDDVLTLGATLSSIAQTVGEASDARLRLLTLCAAGQYHAGRLSAEELGLPDVTAVFNPNELRAYRPASSQRSSQHPSSEPPSLAEDKDNSPNSSST